MKTTRTLLWLLTPVFYGYAMWKLGAPQWAIFGLVVISIDVGLIYLRVTNLSEHYD